MFQFFQAFQSYMFIGFGVFCLILSIFSCFLDFQSFKKKFALIKVEASTGLLMMADALSQIYDGVPGDAAFWKMRIFTFLIFFLSYGVLFFYTEYITILFMEKGRFKKLPKCLLACFILLSIGVTLVIVSQFTGLFYTIDQNNVYTRQKFWVINLFITIIVLILFLSFIYQNKKLVSKPIVISLFMSAVIPIVAGIFQLFFYGISIIDLSFFLASTCLFGFALAAQNNLLIHAANTEVATGLPNTYGFIYEVDKLRRIKDLTNYTSYYFDIVGMGVIDRKYGKFIGDEVIVSYSHSILQNLEKDEILGRLGGNFFVALVNNKNTEKFLKLLEDVPVVVKYNGKEEELHIAAVAGAYKIQSRLTPAGVLIGKTASAVTYAKKVAKKPYVFLDSELEEKLEREKELAEKLNQALINKDFEPYYQPRINTKTRELCGCEALARWINGKKFNNKSYGLCSFHGKKRIYMSA